MKSQVFVDSGPSSIEAASAQLREQALMAGVLSGSRFERARQDSLLVLQGPLVKPTPIRGADGHFTGEKRVTFGSW